MLSAMATYITSPPAFVTHCLKKPRDKAEGGHRLAYGGPWVARPQQRGPRSGSGRCSTRCYTGPMAREISQRELRNDSGEIMRQLDQGQSFIVTRNGVPVGELSPLRRHRFVRADTAVALFRHAPAVDLGKLRDDLDRVASQDPSPRG
jgi:antitoxin (DNA-binding transcriptional repressor) of toxin-antitoxin stability system